VIRESIIEDELLDCERVLVVDLYKNAKKTLKTQC